MLRHYPEIRMEAQNKTMDTLVQWRTQEFCWGGGGSTNSVEDRENGDLGAVAL